METYLKVDEVALMVRLSVTSIRRLTMNKKIPFHKINRAVRYKKSEIEQWFDSRKVPMTDETLKDNEGDLFNETDNRGEA